MARFALFLLACSVLATGVVGMAIQESSELEPIVDSRLLQASASGSGSVSLCGSPGCQLIALIIADSKLYPELFANHLTFFPMMEPIFDMLTPLFEAVVEIAVGLGIVVAPARQVPEFAEYLDSFIEYFSFIFAQFMEAREDPNVGEAFDEQICALAEVLAEAERMMGKSGKGKSLKGRNLKAKSGKGLGIECPEIKSGKSAKTYAPSPTPTTPATSVKSAKSIKAAKSAKATKAMKSLKSGK